MLGAVPQVNPHDVPRIPAFVELTDEELRARHEALVEDVGPKLLTLESLADEIMHRRRDEQRRRLLGRPWLEEAPSTLIPEVV